VVRGARESAVVTHAHPEAQAGAIAVAVAAAVAWRTRGAPPPIAAAELLRTALEATPPGETREGIARARALPPETPPTAAARALGNGSLVTAQDTVPFVLFCAARHLRAYEEALLATVEGAGDCDTTCATTSAPWPSRSKCRRCSHDEGRPV
jgi:ADP-ribosylglycohydrolase